MLKYSKDGDIVKADSAADARESQVVTMARTSRYALRPQAAGKLRELLGSLSPDVEQDEARRRVRRMLQELGVPNPEVGVFAEALPDEWRLRIDI